jgi:polysaccharide deacetylase 2 family uncharacterized protein YibQ
MMRNLPIVWDPNRAFGSRAARLLVLAAAFFLGLDTVWQPALPSAHSRGQEVVVSPGETPSIPLASSVVVPALDGTSFVPVWAQERAYSWEAPALFQASPPAPAFQPQERWRQFALPFTLPTDKKWVVVILDDMGVDVVWSLRALQLPKPLTLSYLPHAQRLKPQTQAAHASGHELMLHLPMESIGGQNALLGANPLLVALPAAEIQRRTRLHLNSFDGYVAVNNHMGSLFTSNRAALDLVMPLLREKGVFFVDSRTTAATQAETAARAAGVPALRRQVFLDDTDDLTTIRGQLALLEQTAQRQGYAIAIGHPRPYTVQALTEWLPGLNNKGLALVPISALLKKQLDAPPLLAAQQGQGG